MEPVVFTSNNTETVCKRRSTRLDELIRKLIGFSRGYGYAYLSFDLYEKNGFSVSITKTEFTGLRVELRFNTGSEIKTKVVEFPEKTKYFVLDSSFPSGEKIELFYSSFLETVSFVSSRKLTKFSN